MIPVYRPSITSSRRLTVLVIGSSGCGKTSALQRIVSNHYSDAAPVKPTLGTELYVKEETWKNEKSTLNIWDCSGAERYRPMIQQLYNNTNEPIRGVILMYDMTNEKSFQELQYWHNEIIRCCPDASILLVGSKSDLTDRLKLTSEDGARQSKEWNLQHLTVSAKSGHNCDGCFTYLLAMIKKASTS